MAVKDQINFVSCCNGKIRDMFECVPARFVVGITGFFGMFTLCFLRVNMSVAIIAMVDYEGLKKMRASDIANNSLPVQHINQSQEQQARCGRLDKPVNETFVSWRNSQKFLWDENIQGLILGSYFYGYVTMQIFGAWIGRKFGRVRVWGVSLLSASVLTIVLPFLTKLGLAGLVATRVIIGMVSGVSYPLMRGMWSAWAPPCERGKLIALPDSGAAFGMTCVLPLAGVLAKKFGWESVFYVTGAVGVVWSICWLILIYDSPADHPRISEREKNYIQNSLGHTDENYQMEGQSGRKIPVPWFAILTSFRYWCAVLPSFAICFAIFTYMTMLPTYLKTMLNFDVQESGALSSIPYIASLFLFHFAGWTADLLIAKGIKRIIVRKVYTAIGMLIPAVAMAITGYAGCNLTAHLILLTIPTAFITFIIPGYDNALLEMAPTFIGITFSISNTIGTTTGFLAPQIIGLFREAYKDDQVQAWRSIFWLAAATNVIGAAAFLLFGTSEKQPWDPLYRDDGAKCENKSLEHEDKDSIQC